jgi:hypothetical protein
MVARSTIHLNESISNPRERSLFLRHADIDIPIDGSHHDATTNRIPQGRRRERRKEELSHTNVDRQHGPHWQK